MSCAKFIMKNRKLQSDDWEFSFIFNFFTDMDKHRIKLFYFFKTIRVQIFNSSKILDKYGHDFGQFMVVLCKSDDVIGDDSERVKIQTSQTDKGWDSDDDK